MDKIERYKWAKTGDKGRHAWLYCDELLIDHSYQRPECSDGNTLRIASDFNWVAFGSIVVMERTDGKKYIVDGQQRWLAAKRRCEQKVPCEIFKSDGNQHEARAFLALNTGRVKVSAVAKFIAAARAGEKPEADISDWLTSIGLHVTSDGKTKMGVCFPSVLVDSWKKGSECAMKAIEVQRQVNGDEPMVGDIHKGLWWLLSHGIDVSLETKKMILAGGKTAMLSSIKVVEIETVQRACYRTCGIGILRIINKKRRNKIAVPEL